LNVIECLTDCLLLAAATASQHNIAIDKDNQDQYCILEHFGSQDAPSQWSLFAVFDGHGKYGTSCAQFAKQKVRSHQPLVMNVYTAEELVMNVYTAVELVMNVYTAVELVMNH
jgi:serine/threonine protein phosphatase PrpC